MNDVICAYWKLSKTVVKHEICSIKSSIHWRNVRINIANSSGEINFLIFNKRHSRTQEVLSKSCWNVKYAE